MAHVSRHLEPLKLVKRALEAGIDEVTLVWKAISASLAARDVFLLILAPEEQMIDL